MQKIDLNNYDVESKILVIGFEEPIKHFNTVFNGLEQYIYQPLLNQGYRDLDLVGGKQKNNKALFNLLSISSQDNSGKKLRDDSMESTKIIKRPSSESSTQFGPKMSTRSNEESLATFATLVTTINVVNVAE